MRKVKIWVAALLALSLVACGNTATETEKAAATNNSQVEATTETSTETTTEEVQTIATASGDEASDKTADEATAEAEEFSLKELFSAHGMKVGTCLTTSMLSNMTQRNIVLSQFDSITMENSMKPDYIFNKKESVATGELVVELNSDAIKMLDFALENGLSVRGHTLIWHSQTPNWIFYEDFDISKKPVGREEMLARMESYIKQMFELLESSGYSSIIYAYDVVNEAWMEDGSMRDSKWKQTIGDDYLWYAFYYANKYAPENIDLYYNDYNEQYKTQTLVDFVETLKDEDGNYLIDGVGFQAHLYTTDNLDKYFQTMDTVAALGLKVQLTELDVCLGSYQKPLKATDDNLKTQGRFYYKLINGILERVDNQTIQMDALTFWGFGDSLSWRKEYSPLLYSILYEPKYAYYGAMQMQDMAGY